MSISYLGNNYKQTSNHEPQKNKKSGKSYEKGGDEQKKQDS